MTQANVSFCKNLLISYRGRVTKEGPSVLSLCAPIHGTVNVCSKPSQYTLQSRQGSMASSDDSESSGLDGILFSPLLFSN